MIDCSDASAGLPGCFIMEVIAVVSYDAPETTHTIVPKVGTLHLFA